MKNTMKVVDVVAAIIKKDNLYLVTQRNRDKYFGLKWEFPGGKVEANETLQEALTRDTAKTLNLMDRKRRMNISMSKMINDLSEKDFSRFEGTMIEFELTK